MAVIDVAFIPVIVTARPLADSPGYAYQQPPAEADPAALRVVAARDVQPGDWYLGDCEQPTAPRRGMFWGVHTYATFETAPAMDAAGESLALDGESFVWRPDELVMVIPAAQLPVPTGTSSCACAARQALALAV
ncbi:hypothetical protein OG883_44135 [Streptomyces sp. NBC_01142]|uniref:hypothetical protein n=1 Tax=Streptomyces sp. NBC_01142 TaxID=2975865 RepID=UPI002257E5A2|nr:hypothetical protein [Streptomyces sp. NBC_01142]MCX4826633.1 hypothetical protein [Streptomyces sp. NBC_01142]